jgi:predicted lipoprotein with Yx(FWY)xxD motif
MLSRVSRQTARSPKRGRASGLLVSAAFATVALIASFATMALASSAAAPTVGSATNAKFTEKIVVDAHGRTLYALSPETTRHLLCKSSQCLKFWPPLTVRSRKTKLTTGSSVHGHLGILRRSNGTLQVTLGGLPLYRYSGDSAKGMANGEHIHSFGGTWHVVSAATSAAPAKAETKTPTGSTPPPTTTNEKYGY